MAGFGWYYLILAFDDYHRGDYPATTPNQATKPLDRQD
jgi:hypothetical protein